MPSVVLVGTPTSGKTALFNRLTGLNQRVANYPGITVDLSIGRLAKLPEFDLVDFPGTYSLRPISEEERVAVGHFDASLADPDVQHLLCIVDATRLEKSLFFCLQVVDACQRQGRPVTVVANMGDILKRHGLSIDAEGLSEAIGAPVLVASARTGEGLDPIISCLQSPPEAIAVSRIVDDNPILASEGGAAEDQLYAEAHRLSAQFGAPADELLRTQSRLDRFFLGSLSGGLIFALIMVILFQSIFTWSAPAMDAVEAGVIGLGGWILPLIGDGLFADFVADAVFSGIGAFLVFVPQIFVLTFVIGLLEDSGYLARAALICHKPLRFFGLSGKSFIPMLSGVACAIPTIYAARSIESPRPVSDLSRDSADALLGEIARVHPSDRHFYPARDRIRGADRLAGTDALRNLCLRYGCGPHHRRLGQPLITLRGTNAFHDGTAGLSHPGTVTHCEKICAAGQALCHQGGCRHSWRDYGDLDFGLLP